MQFSLLDKAKAQIIKALKKKGPLMTSTLQHFTGIKGKRMAEALEQPKAEEQVKDTRIETTQKGGRPGAEYEYIGKD